MRITRIESQKKNPHRKNIFVDGEFFAGVSDETILRFGLRTGDEIGHDKLKALQATEETLSAKRVALRFLAHRPRTVKEIRDKLREKEFGDNEIARVVEEMQNSGLLNDREFARAYIRDVMTLRPTGKLLLKQKLVLLGVERSVIDDAIQDEFKEVDQESAAMDAAKKFMKRTRGARSKQEKLKARNRLANFLGRRGFTWDVINPVLKKMFDSPENDA
ncbi:MAG: RecX family transcriptional regulator [Ignavibacteriae bacterium]|nr:RecX family transcriptional regulator [Ignavibacteriota bacterium]